MQELRATRQSATPPTVRATPSAAPLWHVLSADDVSREVSGDLARGLTPGDAASRLATIGANALAEPTTRSRWRVFFGQFASPLIYLLLGASLVALLLGERSDAAIIAVVVVLNAVIGAVQEGRAERSLRALRKLAQHKARVVRAAWATRHLAAQVRNPLAVGPRAGFH